MTITADSTDLFPILRDMVAECLGVEPEDVLPESHFFEDLGGESIDVIDLNYRVEKRLGLRSPFAAFASHEGWEFQPDGRLTEECRTRWEGRFPNLEWSKLDDPSGGQSPERLMTIDTLHRLIQHALREQQQPTNS